MARTDVLTSPLADIAAKPARQPAQGVAAMFELLKPITWFAPMWAFGCGIVSSGKPLGENLALIVAGIILCGPLVTGTSQAANDWCDRDVDAINEPQRAIPSGRVPGRRGLDFALVWSFLSLLAGMALGPFAFAATTVGVALAWAYSAEPIRLKRNGWWGNTACAACYEGLPWVTGAAIMAGASPSWSIVVVATLYSIGAHGIMTLNDFKSVEGDRATGILSLPAMLGAERAARLACVVMAAPQLVVVALLLRWGFAIHAGAVAALLLAQVACMTRLLRDPKAHAPWYNATGTSLYVLGMLVTAFALRGMAAG